MSKYKIVNFNGRFSIIKEFKRFGFLWNVKRYFCVTIYRNSDKSVWLWFGSYSSRPKEWAIGHHTFETLKEAEEVMQLCKDLNA